MASEDNLKDLINGVSSVLIDPSIVMAHLLVSCEDSGIPLNTKSILVLDVLNSIALNAEGETKPGYPAEGWADRVMAEALDLMEVAREQRATNE